MVIDQIIRAVNGLARRLFLGGLIALSGTSASVAEPNADVFLQRYDSGDADDRLLLEAMAAQMEVGMAWSNVILKQARAQTPIYCPPNGLGLVGSQDISIVRQGIKTNPLLTKVPFGMALIESLKATFPCA